MSESMIEKVARAIWNIRREEEDRCDMDLDDMGLDHPVWTEARAAIEAMRDPTEEVAREAFNHVVTDDWLDFLRGHRAMIDAALKEHEGEK